jgi:hypothetical protein
VGAAGCSRRPGGHLVEMNAPRWAR